MSAPDEGSAPGGGRPHPFHALSRAQRRRLMAFAVVRSITIGTLLIAAYLLLPLRYLLADGSLLSLVVALGVFVIVVALEFRRTMNSPYPRLRAAEAMMTTTPLYLVLFAVSHYVVGRRDPGYYSQPMDQLDALYFTVTTFATVGFGDISPVAALARALTMVQIATGLILVGIVAKLLVGVAQSDGDRLRGTPAP